MDRDKLSEKLDLLPMLPLDERSPIKTDILAEFDRLRDDAKGLDEALAKVMTLREERDGWKDGEMQMRGMRDTAEKDRAMERGLLEKVAREAGWSEAVNCPPWSFLESELSKAKRARGREIAEHPLVKGYERDIERWKKAFVNVHDALQWIAQQPCTRGGDGCDQSGDCITEWCLPCYAKKHLDAKDATEHDVDLFAALLTAVKEYLDCPDHERRRQDGCEDEPDGDCNCFKLCNAYNAIDPPKE